MSAAALASELQASGVKLTVRGKRLHVEAPTGTLTPEVRALLVEHKAALMPLLVMRDRLRDLARSVGVPDRIVVELPASELQACIDQLPFWDGDELRTRVLVFYLRSLAGIEPTLPGSLVERDAPARRARWQA